MKSIHIIRLHKHLPSDLLCDQWDLQRPLWPNWKASHLGFKKIPRLSDFALISYARPWHDYLMLITPRFEWVQLFWDLEQEFWTSVTTWVTAVTATSQVAVFVCSLSYQSSRFVLVSRVPGRFALNKLHWPGPIEPPHPILTTIYSKIVPIRLCAKFDDGLQISTISKMIGTPRTSQRPSLIWVGV